MDAAPDERKQSTYMYVPGQQKLRGRQLNLAATNVANRPFPAAGNDIVQCQQPAGFDFREAAVARSSFRIEDTRSNFRDRARVSVRSMCPLDRG